MNKNSDTKTTETNPLKDVSKDVTNNTLKVE